MIGTHLGVKRFIEIGWSHGCDHFSTAYQERKCEVPYRTRVNEKTDIFGSKTIIGMKVPLKSIVQEMFKILARLSP